MPGVEAVAATGVTPLSALSFETGPEVSGASASGSTFATSLSGAVENLQQLQSSSNELAVQAVQQSPGFITHNSHFQSPCRRCVG